MKPFDVRATPSPSSDATPLASVGHLAEMSQKIVAVEKGNAYAQFSLAGLYASGTGVQRDLQKAYSLFTLAGSMLDVRKQVNQIQSQVSHEDLAARQPATSREWKAGESSHCRRRTVTGPGPNSYRRYSNTP
jgi:hypothetical protein